ncbi:MAG: heme exporter protein CcmB [Fimbriimonadales bacterium]|nr:heme exporter protein CcmB [Fimbriimonadales bacterium]
MSKPAMESPSLRPIAPSAPYGATSRWSWAREVLAIWRKDLRQEWRQRQGLTASLLMGVATVVGVGFAALGQALSSGLQAGLFWVALLFGMLPALARGFIAEEEAGTADLLRVAARPASVFWGKWLFHATLYGLLSGVLIPLYGLLVAPLAGRWESWLLLWLGGGFCMTSVLTLCSALAAQTAVRGALLAGLTFPLLLPLMLLLIAGTRQTIEGVFPAEPLQGVFGYALALGAGGAWVFERIWRE